MEGAIIPFSDPFSDLYAASLQMQNVKEVPA
jgi:hypothetical protein